MLKSAVIFDNAKNPKIEMYRNNSKYVEFINVYIPFSNYKVILFLKKGNKLKKLNVNINYLEGEISICSAYMLVHVDGRDISLEIPLDYDIMNKLFDVDYDMTFDALEDFFISNSSLAKKIDISSFKDRISEKDILYLESLNLI